MAFPWLKTGEGPPNKGKPMPIAQREKLSRVKRALVEAGWKPANHGKKMAYTEEHRTKLRANWAKLVQKIKKRHEGDRFLDDHRGYIWVAAPKGTAGTNSVGYIHEHRLIAQRVLGRPLQRHEVVHHINGDKTDNRHTNLLICDAAFHRWLHQRMSELFQQTVFGREVVS